MSNKLSQFFLFFSHVDILFPKCSSQQFKKIKYFTPLNSFMKYICDSNENIYLFNVFSCAFLFKKIFSDQFLHNDRIKTQKSRQRINFHNIYCIIPHKKAVKTEKPVNIHLKRTTIIIKKQQIMKINSNTILILVLALLEVSCQFTSIDPSNYIWINYTALVPVMQTKDQKYATRIPCESRIGKCSYKFNLLPPGWTATSDGTIQIPKLDATKEGAFAVNADLSQPTGQKINANLIVQIKRGFLSVSDSPAFFQTRGYQPQKNEMFKNVESKYVQSPLTTATPSGFPTIDELNRQSVSQLNILIPKIIQKYAPCRSKINFLTSVKSLLESRAQQNKYQLDGLQSNLEQQKIKLDNLRAKRQQSLKLSGTRSRIESTRSNLNSLYNQLLLIGNQKNIYEKLALSAYNKMQALSSEFQDQRTDQIYHQLALQEPQFKSMLLQRGYLQKNILKRLFQTSLNKLNEQNKFKGNQLQRKFNATVEQIASLKVKQVQTRIKITDQEQARSAVRYMIGIIVQELKNVDQKLKLYDINLTNTTGNIVISQSTKEKVKNTLNSKIKALSDQNLQLNKILGEVDLREKKFNQICTK